MKYLDEKLALLKALLVKENLNRYGLDRLEWGRPGSSHRPCVPAGCWRPSGSCSCRPFCGHWAPTLTSLLTSTAASTSHWR